MLNKEQIMDIIPHRDPFLLIDEIIEIEPGKRAVGLKHLTENEDWFRGHFPGNPVQPGVLMVEMLAQTAGVCVLSLPEHKGKTGYFAGINDCRFRRMVRPGETIRLEIEVIKLRGAVCVVKAAATVDGERAVNAELTFAVS